MDDIPVTFLHEAERQQADKYLPRLQGKRAKAAVVESGMLTTFISGIWTIMTALATTLLLVVGIDIRATDHGTDVDKEMSDATDLDFTVKYLVQNKRLHAVRLLRQKADELDKMDATGCDHEEQSSPLTQGCLNFESEQSAFKSSPSASASSCMCRRHPSVQLSMCLECALEKSSVQVTAVPSEFAKMDDFLRMWCYRREPVPGDGHCIVHSWTKALEMDYWQFCYPDAPQALLYAAIDEISEHQEFYGPFLSPDWRKELDDYVQKKEYDTDVVDLLFHALCNVTQASCQIITLGAKGIQVDEPLLPYRLKKLPTRDVVLCRVGSHYDAAVSTWGSTEDDTGLETSTEIWKMNHKDERRPGASDELSDLTEAEKQQAKKELKELQGKTEKMMTKAKDTATSLREAADKLDKVWKDCKIAHASGTSAGVVGGILTIIGGVLTILTAGAATPVLIAGMVVGFTGAGTNLGTSFIEACINSSEIRKAEKDLEQTLDCIRDVDSTVQMWLNKKEKEKLSYIFFLATRTLDASKPLAKILKKVSSALGISGNIVEGVEKIALQAGKSSAQAAGDVAESSAKAGVKAGAKLAGRVIIGLSAVFLVFDAIDLGFTIKDIVQKKGSKAAIFLREKADKLERVC